MKLDSRRFFSTTQRNEIFVMYKGRCAICGEKLDENWQADHIIPWSQGGRTVIENGQPTCETCNKKKGVSTMKPREWQAKFLRSYEAWIDRDYLLVATPGAGKTSASLLAAKQLIQRREIEKVIVVCPTSSLKKQWADSAANFGIQLDPNWENGPIKRDYHGICLTYSKTVHSERMLQFLCDQDAMIILDEIHHSGDDKAWGISVTNSFEESYRVLGLSGTPFRGDNSEIPFVQYEKGVAIPQFTYGYKDAIKDNVCRMVMSPSLDGGAEFYHRGKMHEWNSFTDITNRDEESQLLKALLIDVEGDYLTEVLTEANERLDEIRRHDTSNAGGLVVSISTDHADSIANRLEFITGEKPAVVHSNTPNPTDIIKNFAKSKKKWIVAVRMVSEGVDIKRLRVGVYATNIMQELTFRQIIGRVVRRTDEYDKWAYFYIPLAPRLVEFMTRIKDEITHVINEGRNKPPAIDIDYNEDEPKEPKEYTPSPIIPTGTDRNRPEDKVIAESQSYNFDEAKRRKEQAEQEMGITLNEWEWARIMEIARDEEDQSEPELKPEKPKYLKKEKLGPECNRAAYSAASQIKAMYDTSLDTRQIVSRIHAYWNKQAGIKSQRDATVAQLEKKLIWLKSGQVEKNPRWFL